MESGGRFLDPLSAKLSFGTSRLLVVANCLERSNHAGRRNPNANLCGPWNRVGHFANLQDFEQALAFRTKLLSLKRPSTHTVAPELIGAEQHFFPGTLTDSGVTLGIFPSQAPGKPRGVPPACSLRWGHTRRPVLRGAFPRPTRIASPLHQLVPSPHLHDQTR